MGGRNTVASKNYTGSGTIGESTIESARSDTLVNIIVAALILKETFEDIDDKISGSSYV